MASAPKKFAERVYEEGVHSIEGVITHVQTYKTDTHWGVFSVKASNGRSASLIGTVEGARKGLRVSFAGLKYGKDERYKRYGYYITKESIRMEPGMSLLDRKTESPEAASQRAAAVERLPIEVDQLIKYICEITPGVGEVKGQHLMNLLTPRGGAYDIIAAIEKMKPTEFSSAAGMSPSDAAAVQSAWNQAASVHLANVSLRTIGLNKTQATGALKKAMHAQKGAKPLAPEVAALRICQHPYRLTTIDGIGFGTADHAARVMGLPRKSRGRIAAAAREAMDRAVRDGNTCCYLAELSEAAAALANHGLDDSAASDQAIDAADVFAVIYEHAEEEGLCFPEGKDGVKTLVAMPGLAAAEARIASRIIEKIAEPIARPVRIPEPGDMDEMAGFPLDKTQHEAIRIILKNNFSILTGGPGCGKTTIAKTLIDVFEKANMRVLLAAPTGMAASRMQAATGRAAQTSHVMLGSKGIGNGFRHDQNNPLEADVVMLDETSMNDTWLTDSQLAAIGPGTRLIWIGDEDQLPSVGAGSVLRDLIASGIPAVARLTATFRFDGPIAELARNIRDGITEWPASHDTDKLELIHIDRDEIARETLQRVIHLRKSGVAADSIMVLTPKNDGPAGVLALNQSIQRAVNPQGASSGVPIAGRLRFPDRSEIRAGVGDRVMHRTNDKELGLTNGDVGVVLNTGGTPARPWLTADFGQGAIRLEGRKALSALHLAYAATVHKSQGSEYPHVLMVVSREHQRMLYRNLIYTGVTRAKQKLHILGDPNVLVRGIANISGMNRVTNLNSLLQKELALRGDLKAYEDKIVHLKRTRVLAPPNKVNA